MCGRVLTGAWVETSHVILSPSSSETQVASSRARGLKPHDYPERRRACWSRVLTGAWVETVYSPMRREPVSRPHGRVG